ncbi:hypothetical protein CKA32_004798 [Geitlerinema sp. FC II]|nr:hypothetical protein CKA32_004798 [Geitlerinema sp. FC II]
MTLTCFFAYSYAGEFPIEKFIELINGDLNKTLNFVGWKDSSASQLVSSKVRKEISDCDLFCVDLTGCTENVLFELGYAIAKNKKVWVVRDKTNISSEKKLRNLSAINSIEYQEYSNSDDLLQKFNQCKPHQGKPMMTGSFASTLDKVEIVSQVLFLQGYVETEFTKSIMEEIETNRLLEGLIKDDPDEATHSCTWYVENVLKTPNVLIEFSSINRRGYETHNQKCSFVCGLAFGFDRNVKIVSESPITFPIDFQEDSLSFESPRDMKNEVQSFLVDIPRRYYIDQQDIRKRVDFLREQRVDKKDAKLTSFPHLGDEIAENEQDLAPEYYDDSTFLTKEYVLKKDIHNHIIVGRKGTGKTATLFFLRECIQGFQNYCVSIRLAYFDLDSISDIFQSVSASSGSKMFVIAALWKFLIYTEVFKVILDELSTKQELTLSQEEEELLNIVKEKRFLFSSENIIERFDELISECKSVLCDSSKGSEGDLRAQISQTLHLKQLNKIRSLLSNVMNKRSSILVMIDNLDKSWDAGKDIEFQARVLYSLLETSDSVVKEFRKIKVDSLRTPLNFRLVTFLRSDIFYSIKSWHPESDKIKPSCELSIDPQNLRPLFNIIDRRIQYFGGKELGKTLSWKDYIFDKNEDLHAQLEREISSRIIPRPRDIIYFFERARVSSIRNQHSSLHKTDIDSAYSDYSKWLVDSLSVEAKSFGLRFIRDFLYELFGKNSIVEEEELYCIISDISSIEQGVEIDDDKFDEYVSVLVDLSILAREVRDSDFRFEYSMDNRIKDKNLKLSEKYSRETNTSKRYKIHPSLYPFLEIKRSYE